MPAMTTIAPLAGLRAVDLCDEKGELCARLLADLGADVIRVEPPGGSRSRSLPPFHGDTSLHFAYRNSNKRGVALDLESSSDRERLHGLLAGADVLVESFAPGALAALGLGSAELRERHPHLIVTSITEFGQTGPYRDRIATDMVLEALGGMIFKAGIPEKPPLTPPATLACDIASVSAAFATLLACWQKRETGAGQHIDFSMLEAVAQTTDWSFSNASVIRFREQEPSEVRVGSGPIYTIYPCKDGYVRLIVLSPRQWRAMRKWLGEPESLQEDHWDSFIARLSIMDILQPLYTEHFAKMEMDEVCVEAQKRGIVCTPVLPPARVLTNEHLRSRDTFVQAEIAPGASGPVAAGFFEADGVRQGFRWRAPTPGEHDALLDDAGWSPRPAPADPAPAPSAPLAGLRVLDFGIGGVGVEGGRLLAEYGADVIKIETRTYPDFIRVILSTEMSPSFASSSRSKRGFGVNAKLAEGLAVLQRLIEHADVIIENGSTGMMDELGVGFAAAKKLNPRVVVVSSQLLGSHGAWADWIGYGPSTQPIGGLVHLWNYTDQDFPAGSAAIFPDHLAGRLSALAAMAGLFAREQTGAGSHVEVAQVEAVTGLLGDLLLKEGLDPGSVRPMGNRSERGAPWGVYPCAGEQQWCAINVRDDDDWRRLRSALGDPAWAADAALAAAEGRFAAHEEIDAWLEEWTRARDKREVEQLLQQHGVPAGAVLTGTDQLDDPQLIARGYPRTIEQQDQGPITLEGPCWHATGMADAIIFEAPRLGEHTREICSELLGMNEAEIDRLLESGALEGLLAQS